jgi:hypothetical protein
MVQTFHMENEIGLVVAKTSMTSFVTVAYRPTELDVHPRKSNGVVKDSALVVRHMRHFDTSN